MHDGTWRRLTVRISQREEEYVKFIQKMVIGMGARAWTYREGRHRRLYVVEFSRGLLSDHGLRTRRDQADYARGYFDAEGGIPTSPSEEPYLYFAQKNRSDLVSLRRLLGRLGISCGRMHNPSRRMDPLYWRFYVRRNSIRDFFRLVGSWHPRKAKRLASMTRSL